MGHSFGVKNEYYQIMKLEEKKRIKMVKMFIAFGGNFSGTAEGDYSLITSEDYYKVTDFFKFHFQAYMNFSNHTPAIYETRMTDTSQFKG